MPVKIHVEGIVSTLTGEAVRVSLERDGFDVSIEGTLSYRPENQRKFHVCDERAIMCYVNFNIDEVHSVVVCNNSVKPTIMLKNNDGENGDI